MKNARAGYCNEIYSFNHEEKGVRVEHTSIVIQNLQKRILNVEVDDKKVQIPYENFEKDKMEIEGKLF